MRPFVAAACLALAATASAVAATVRAPVVRLADTAPVVVRGTGFASRENVRVTLTRNGRVHSRRARASAAGAFRVGFGLLVLDPCRGAIVVRAVGVRGSRATLRRACRTTLP